MSLNASSAIGLPEPQFSSLLMGFTGDCGCKHTQVEDVKIRTLSPGPEYARLRALEPGGPLVATGTSQMMHAVLTWTRQVLGPLSMTNHDSTVHRGSSTVDNQRGLIVRDQQHTNVRAVATTL